MQRLLDATAVGLSGLCFIHCLILPFAAASLPLISLFTGAEWVHWVFVAMAAPIAAVAIGPVLLEQPRPWGIPTLAAAGVLLLLCGATNFPDPAWGTGLTVAGGVGLASAHLLNRRRAHKGHRHEAEAGGQCR